MKAINQYVFRVNYEVEIWVYNETFSDHEQLIIYNSDFPSMRTLKTFAYEKCSESWPEADHIHVTSIVLDKIVETSVKVKG